MANTPLADGGPYVPYAPATSAAALIRGYPARLAKLVNANTNAQPFPIQLLDAVSVASSAGAPVLFTALLGPSQVITIGIDAQFGIVAQMVGGASASGPPINVVAF